MPLNNFLITCKKLLIKKELWLGLFFLALCLLNVNRFIFEKKFEGDIASRMMLVFGHTMGFGSAYTDLWEIIPPGYILVLQIWASVFGKNVLAFVLLHFITLLMCAVLLTLVLRKLFTSYTYYVTLLITSIVFFSPALHSMYISSELFGSFFTLLALYCLLYFQNTKWRIGASLAFFVIAGQMKDPFLFGIIAVGPFILWKFLSGKDWEERSSIFLTSIIGIAAPILFFAGYLVLTGSMRGYQLVFATKSGLLNNFNLYSYIINAWRSMLYVEKQFIHFLTFSNLFVSIAPLLAIIWSLQNIKAQIKRKVVMISFDFKRIENLFSDDFFAQLGMPFFILGSYMGMYAQGSFSSHYLIQSVIPLYLFLGLVFTVTMSPFQKMLAKYLGSYVSQMLFCILLILIMIPNSYYARIYVFDWSHNNAIRLNDIPGTIHKVLESYTADEYPQIAMEQLLNKKVSADECILHIYGWHVSRTYLESEKKPCTRFFLTNIVIRDWQREEYRNEIYATPPKALVYSHGGADFNIKSFEESVLNWPAIIEQCYTVDPQFIEYSSTFPATLYWARFEKIHMQECVKAANILPKQN